MWSMLSLLVPAAALHAQPTGNDTRPNIIVIFLDDQAYQSISAYGSKLMQTPNMDRIANEGMRFDRCLVTNSICGPSRAVLLTGKYSHINGKRDNHDRFDNAQQTYPKLLQKAGYQTAMIGKWHLDGQPQGYDHWIILPGQGDYYNPQFISPRGNFQVEGYVTDIITDMAIDWLKNERDPGRPFMLNYHHKAPHRTWMPGPDQLHLLRDEKLPEPANLFDDYSTRATPASRQEMEIDRHMDWYYDLKVPPRDGLEMRPNRHAGGGRYLYEQRFTPAQKAAWDAAYRAENEELYRNLPNMTHEEIVRWKYQRYIKDYLRTIAGIDANLGRLLAYLDEAGLSENTVIIYASDQGFYLGEHGWYDKRWMYEQSLRTPFMVRWPGVVKPGSTCDALVSILDFAPTILDIAQVPIPEDMQGRSMLPILRGEVPDDWRTSFYYHYFEQGEHNVPRHCGVRTQRYKLIHFYTTGEWELYDLETDPDEMKNIYHDPANAQLVTELKMELERLRQHYRDDQAPAVTP